MLLAAVLAFQSGPSLPARDPCLDDNHRNVCSATVQAEVLDKLGLKSIAAEAESGAEVYRARFVDGYGRDMPAVAFVRRPGQEPMVEVSGVESRKMSGPVSLAVWQDVVRRARFADRDLLPLESGNREGIGSLCFHAWVVSIEMANPSGGGSGGRAVRQKTASACGAGLTTDFAFDLADKAKQALPACDALDQSMTRGAVGALAVCMRLTGDRLAAASLFNTRNTGGPRYGLDRKDAGVWRAYLGTNGSPKLDWAGQKIETDRGRNNHVAVFIADQVAADERLRFEPQDYHGESSKRARIQGRAINGKGQNATYHQTWVWDPNLSEWMVEDFTVGEFSATD